MEITFTNVLTGKTHEMDQAIKSDGSVELSIGKEVGSESYFANELKYAREVMTKQRVKLDEVKGWADRLNEWEGEFDVTPEEVAELKRILAR